MGIMYKMARHKKKMHKIKDTMYKHIHKAKSVSCICLSDFDQATCRDTTNTNKMQKCQCSKQNIQENGLSQTSRKKVRNLFFLPLCLSLVDAPSFLQIKYIPTRGMRERIDTLFLLLLSTHT